MRPIFLVKNLLWIMILLFFISCEDQKIEEEHVCKSITDCREGYECLFQIDENKDYGKCVKEIECKDDSLCEGRTCHTELKKCVSLIPIIETSKLDDAQKDIGYEFQISAKNIKPDFFYYETEDLPKGLTISDSGLVSGIPTEGGEFNIKLKLYNIKKGSTEYYNILFVEKVVTLHVGVDPCVPNNCRETNKTICIRDDSENGYSCGCNDNFVLVGDDCLEDKCIINPCTELNQTVCINDKTENGYSCTCDEGYEIINGECKIDYCGSGENLCRETNKTICVNSDTILGYECRCDEGFDLINGVCTKDYCEPNPCTDPKRNRCNNIDTGRHYECLCNGAYYDDHGTCKRNPCKTVNACNGSREICIPDSTTEFHCGCEDGYLRIDDTCKGNPCFSGINPCNENHKTICTAAEDYQSVTCDCDEGYSESESGNCVVPGDICSNAITIDIDTIYTGDTSLMEGNFTSTICSINSTLARDAVYKLELTERKLVTATLRATTENFNVSLYLKTECGDGNGNELLCEKSFDGDNSVAQSNKILEPGTYYFIIDGYIRNGSGEYTFKVEFNDPCQNDIECGESRYCDLDSNVCFDDKCVMNQVSCDNGTCEQKTGLCDCDDGYFNDNNICLVDNCYQVDCGTNSECIRDDSEAQYHCDCELGFLKAGNGECLANPCSTLPCTEAHKRACTYEISEDSISYSCNCDPFYLENEEGVCTATIMNECPGVNMPVGIELSGDTTNLEDNYHSKTSWGTESAKGNEAVYQFTLQKKSLVTITMRNGTDVQWDRYLHLRSVCNDINTQITYNDTLYSKVEKIEKTLNAGTYYVFADGYNASKKGAYAIKLDVVLLCENNNECTGENEICGSNGKCECDYGYSIGVDNKCHLDCQDSICEDNLHYECKEDNLCYRRETCLEVCHSNSTCNLDSLECECNTNYTFNDDGICVPNLCATNNITCSGEHVSCNKILGSCQCETGYENYQENIGCVEDTNPCTPGEKCRNNEVCNPIDETNFECLCKTGFIKDGTDVCIKNACLPNPCGLNSICELDVDFRSYCSCEAGFEYNNLNICTELLGNSCSTPIELSLNSSFEDDFTMNLSKTGNLSCQTENQLDKVYHFKLNSTSQVTINVAGDNFNGSYGLINNCENFNELTCGNNEISQELPSGDYYLYVNSENATSLTITLNVLESVYVNPELLDAVIGIPYNEEIIINGGITPYVVALKAGEVLPDGLTLVDGHLIGTPTSIFDGSFIITVTDQNGVGTPVEFTINLKVILNDVAVEAEIGNLVINEVYFAVQNDTNGNGAIENGDEFIEIVNITYKKLSLDNLSIWDSLDGSYRHQFSGVLNPGEVIVVFGGDVSSMSENHATFVSASSGRLSLNDNGDKVRIMKNGSIVIAEMQYYQLIDNSLNLNPDITGTEYLPHSQVSGNETKYTPGKKADGSSF